MFGQKNWLVILVKPHELEIFAHEAKLSTNLILPTTVVNNLEVLDREELSSLIGTYTKSQPYQATDILWLLSPSLIFEQTFPDSDKEKWDTQTVQFLDAVPFEEILSHIYTPSGGRSVVATNQDLINSLIQAFSAQGYQTKIVIPSKMQDIDSNLTVESVKKILGNLNQLYKDNLITPSDDKTNFVPESTGTLSYQKQPKSKSQLPLLLSVFGVLLAILVIVIYLNQ